MSVVDLKAAREDMRGVRETRISARSEFELREVPNGTGGTNLRFTGFACVTDAEYEMEDWIGPWIESVSVGAFKKTLNDGADVAFLLNHDGMTLARSKSGTLKLSEQTEPTISPIDGVTGLYSEAMLDPQNMYVQAMRSAVDRGDLDEMSFAFRVMRQEWNDAGTRRWISEVSLDKGDVSLVNYAASPATGGTVSMRKRQSGARTDRSGSRRSSVPFVLPPDSTIEVAQKLSASRARAFTPRARSVLPPDPTIGPMVRAQARSLRSKHV